MSAPKKNKTTKAWGGSAPGDFIFFRQTEMERDMSDEKKVEEKIKKLANKKTSEALDQLLPSYVEITNSLIDEPLSEREKKIAGLIMSFMLKQIILVSITNDNEALEQIAREVEDEMEEE